MRFRALFSTWTLALAAVGLLGGPASPARAAGDDAPEPKEYLPDSTVLARVEDRVITIGDFRDAYFSSDANYRPQPDSTGRIEFLNSMVTKEVLGLTAMAIGKPLTFEDRTQIKDYEDRTLTNTLYLERIRDPATPTEEEVRAIYPQYEKKAELSQIVVDDRDLAESIRRDLIAGRIGWNEAVTKYSLSHDGEDGYLGWKNRVQMRGDAGIKAFEVRPGGISEVAQTTEGYIIYRCLGVEPTKPYPFGTIKRTIANDLRTARTLALVESFYDELRKRAHAVYDTAQIKWVVDRFTEFEKKRTPTAGVELNAPIPVFDATDLNRVLARTDDRELTLQQFVLGYRGIPGPIRRRLIGVHPVVMTIDGMLLEGVMLEVARETGVENDPRAKKALARRIEQAHVEHMYSDSVASKIEVTDEEMKAHYEARKEEFVTVPRVRYARVLCPTEAGADSLIAELAAGTKMEDVVDARGGSIQTVTRSEASYLAKLLFEDLRPGQAAKFGPDLNGAFVVAQLLEYLEPRPMSFDEVQTVLSESVYNEKAEKLLDEMVARLRKRYTIEVHLDRLNGAKMVDPLLDA